MAASADASASVVQTTNNDLASPPKAKQPRVSRQLEAEQLAAAAFAGVPPSGENGHVLFLLIMRGVFAHHHLSPLQCILYFCINSAFVNLCILHQTHYLWL